jgi:hypothetical protein
MQSKLVGLAFLCGLSAQLNAQSNDEQAVIRKGSIAINGSAYFQSYGSPGSTHQYAFVQPSLTLYLKDNLALLVGIRYDGTTSTNKSTSFVTVPSGLPPSGSFAIVPYESTDERSSSLLGPVVGIQYYKWIGKRFALTASGVISARFGSRSHSITVPPSGSSSLPYEASATTLSITSSIGPGIAYHLNERWLLTASFGSISYDYSETQGAPQADENLNLYNARGGISGSFQASLTSGLSLGFQYFLRRK